MKHLLATKPNELVCMDFTLLEKSSDGIGNVLVITDAFTKWTRNYSNKGSEGRDCSKDFGQRMVLSVCSTQEVTFRPRKKL